MGIESSGDEQPKSRFNQWFPASEEWKENDMNTLSDLDLLILIDDDKGKSVFKHRRLYSCIPETGEGLTPENP